MTSVHHHAPVAAVPGLEQDEPGARIVGEELKLLATVQRALDDALGAERASAMGRQEDDKRLLELRDDVAVAKPEDLPALFEQMHTLSALRTQRGRGAIGALDRGSPYFGHLRLDEAGKRRDVLIGGRSYVDAAAGIRVVDWRNAPVSRIYYRYAQGDDYEESLGGRTVEGVVVARRSVAISGGEKENLCLSCHQTGLHVSDKGSRGNVLILARQARKIPAHVCERLQR